MDGAIPSLIEFGECSINANLRSAGATGLEGRSSERNERAHRMLGRA